MRVLVLSWSLLAACGNKPQEAPAPPPKRDASVADLDRAKLEAEQAKLEEEQKRLQADIDAFEKRIDDPAHRGPGWTKVPALEDKIARLWGVYASEDDVIATGHGGLLVRSTDGGTTWSKIAPGPLGEPLGYDKVAPLIAEVTGAGDYRYVIGFENPLVGVSVDKGATWKRISLGDGENPVEPVGLVAAGSDVYIADETRIFVSHDHLATWKVEKTLTIGADDTREGIRGLVGSRDGSSVYAYGRDHGKPLLLRSRDHGRSWQSLGGGKAFAPPYTWIFDAAVGPDGALYTHPITDGMADGGPRDNKLAVSRDGGGSWSVITVPFVGDPSEINDTDGWWSPARLWVGPDNALWVAINGRNTLGLQVSRDRGKTWTNDLSFSPDAIAFTKNATYAVGHRGNVWIKRSK
jgi:photosystem II stability/assembly factor-like uncharacterized protein